MSDQGKVHFEGKPQSDQKMVLEVEGKPKDDPTETKIMPKHEEPTKEVSATEPAATSEITAVQPAAADRSPYEDLLALRSDAPASDEASADSDEEVEEPTARADVEVTQEAPFDVAAGVDPFAIPPHRIPDAPPPHYGSHMDLVPRSEVAHGATAETSPLAEAHPDGQGRFLYCNAAELHAIDFPGHSLTVIAVLGRLNLPRLRITCFGTPRAFEAGHRDCHYTEEMTIRDPSVFADILR